MSNFEVNQCVTVSVSDSQTWATQAQLVNKQLQNREKKIVKGSHRPRPLTRLRRPLIDKTTPITLIRTRRMRIDEFVCIMAVGGRWRSFLLLSVKPQGRNKMCIGLTVYPIL